MAGREASCATIRPALHDRRRRSRLVRAHLSECGDCRAIAGSRGGLAAAFAPFGWLVLVTRRVGAWFATEGTVQGAAAGAGSGATRPMAAAGLAVVAALAGGTFAEQQATSPRVHSAAKHAQAAPRHAPIASTGTAAAPAPARVSERTVPIALSAGAGKARVTTAAVATSKPAAKKSSAAAATAGATHPRATQRQSSAPDDRGAGGDGGGRGTATSGSWSGGGGDGDGGGGGGRRGPTAGGGTHNSPPADNLGGGGHPQTSDAQAASSTRQDCPHPATSAPPTS
jgi:uncharacterized membrane protein YgcG